MSLVQGDVAAHEVLIMGDIEELIDEAETPRKKKKRTEDLEDLELDDVW